MPACCSRIYIKKPLVLFKLGEVVKAFTKADPSSRARITELEQLVKSQSDELSALRGQLETLTWPRP